MDDRKKATVESDKENACLKKEFETFFPKHPILEMDCIWIHDIDVVPEAVHECVLLLMERFEYWDIGYRDIYYYCRIPKQSKGCPLSRPIKVRKDIVREGSFCTAIIKAVLEAEILAGDDE